MKAIKKYKDIVNYEYQDETPEIIGEFRRLTKEAASLEDSVITMLNKISPFMVDTLCTEYDDIKYDNCQSKFGCDLRAVSNRLRHVSLQLNDAISQLGI